MTNHRERDVVLQEIKYIRDNFVQILENDYQYNLLICKEKLKKIIDSGFKTIVSADKALEYTEIASGLYQALLKIDELPVKHTSEIDEMISLCIELSDYLIKKLQVEKKVVYFLPYKLDMWDSLESIWQALNEDEQFDVHVMPIPWAERNRDGSVKKWHCEINEFSKYVPVVDYRKVDLSVIKPDVIFIHNPYDGNNLITSVDERYYSNKLKQQTETLIYVPYFVVKDEINPDKCQCPAIQYADYVIVQDENIKKQYEENYLWGDPKGKFLPFGSPKIDKILNSKRSDYVLPLAWRRKISGKKVILYNTSIRDMLENDDGYLDKLRSTFDFFRNKTDIVLWWRPHPLLKSSISIIKTEIYQDYCDLEKQYKQEAWGIYDDSFDVNRAITYSDAYYGDNSSLLWLYKKTGKITMRQNYSIIDEHKEKGLSTYFYTTNGKKSWVIYYWQYTPYLWEIDNQTGEAILLVKLPVVDYEYYNYGCLTYFDDKVFIFPWQGRGRIQPLQYNLRSNNLSEIDVDLPQLDAIDCWWFVEYPVIIGDRLVAVSNKSNIILEYNKITKIWKCLMANWGKGHVELVDVYKDKIILLKYNELGIMDSNTLETRWKLIPGFTQGWRMSIIKDKLWIINISQDEIIVYDFLQDTIIRKNLPSNEKKCHMFFTAVPYQNEVLLLSGYKGCSLILKLKNGRIEMRQAKFTVDNTLGKQRFSEDLFGERFGAVKVISHDWFTISGDGSSLLYYYNGDNYKIDIHINGNYIAVMEKDLNELLGEHPKLTDNVYQLVCTVKSNDNEYANKEYENEKYVLCSEKVKIFLRGL